VTANTGAPAIDVDPTRTHPVVTSSESSWTPTPGTTTTSEVQHSAAATSDTVTTSSGVADPVVRGFQMGALLMQFKAKPSFLPPVLIVCVL